MEHPPSTNKRRETVLTFTLVAVLAAAFVFFLNMVSLGVFFYVIVALVGMVAVGFLHYALWGHSLSQEVAGEREEEEIRRKLEVEENSGESLPAPHREERYYRRKN